MQDNNQTNMLPDEPKIVQTDAGAKDGQNKCPKCGATEISLNVNTGLLRCHFCRHEFEPEKIAGLETDLSKLEGQIVGSGAKDIVADTNEVLTFKCSSCGAEVVIDTAAATQARCHWCRNTLSVNQQIPNGAVPDVVLPFKLKKEEARTEIEKFVNKRKFFAHPTFKKEFCAENVMGVYLPYMVIDINAHASFTGQGEIEKFVGKRKFFAHPQFKKEFCTENIMGVYLPYMVVDINANANLTGQGETLVRTYYRGEGKNRETYYDADLYDVEREFDIVVDGLTVESSADKLNNRASNKTNNVINAIMPFDTENSVKWNANYLKGYSSEKRDTNIDQLKNRVQTQAKDISRHKANDTLRQYNRGVAWSKEDLNVKGEQWKAAYLPVWLYSYHQKNKNMLHYVAVNARTKETMGSVPINMLKLLGISALVEVMGFVLWLVTMPFLVTSEEDGDWGLLFLTLGFVFYGFMYARYRNKGARHFHEKETKATMDNLRKKDSFVTKRTGLTNEKMAGANNTSVRGSAV
jgi:DNA-directed RNA polymerase subunit RPC12/RpoP